MFDRKEIISMLVEATNYNMTEKGKEVYKEYFNKNASFEFLRNEFKKQTGMNLTLLGFNKYAVQFIELNSYEVLNANLPYTRAEKLTRSEIRFKLLHGQDLNRIYPKRDLNSMYC